MSALPNYTNLYKKNEEEKKEVQELKDKIAHLLQDPKKQQKAALFIQNLIHKK